MPALLLLMSLLPMVDPVPQDAALMRLRLDDKEVWSAERHSVGPLLPQWIDTGSIEPLPTTDQIE